MGKRDDKEKMVELHGICPKCKTETGFYVEYKAIKNRDKFFCEGCQKEFTLKQFKAHKSFYD